MKVALPRFGESVAPCFEHTATISIFEVASGRVGGQTDFSLHSRDPFDRVRLLRDQEVDTLICGGMQHRFQDILEGRGIHVISWVSGNVDELLARFLAGDLKPGQVCVCEKPEPGESG